MLQALERNLEAPCSERRLEHEISNRGELCLLPLISPLATGQLKPPQHERPSHTLTRTLQAIGVGWYTATCCHVGSQRCHNESRTVRTGRCSNLLQLAAVLQSWCAKGNPHRNPCPLLGLSKGCKGYGEPARERALGQHGPRPSVAPAAPVVLFSSGHEEGGMPPSGAAHGCQERCGL